MTQKKSFDYWLKLKKEIRIKASRDKVPEDRPVKAKPTQTLFHPIEYQFRGQWYKKFMAVSNAFS